MIVKLLLFGLLTVGDIWLYWRWRHPKSVDDQMAPIGATFLAIGILALQGLALYMTTYQKLSAAYFLVAGGGFFLWMFIGGCGGWDEERAIWMWPIMAYCMDALFLLIAPGVV